MKFDIKGSPEISFVKNLVKEVSETYLKHLSNKMYFKMKLSCLSVRIYETNMKTDGSVGNDQENNELKIILSVNPMDSKKYIAFIIAHEFAHLLMCNVSDALGMSRKVSSVIRLNEDGVSYGDQLEELFADYLAHYIVSRMNLNDENEQYAIHKIFCKAKMAFVEKMENYFGESLMDTEYIDFKVERYVEKENSVLNEYSIPEPNYSANFLWYSVVNDSFDKVIEMYNCTIDSKEESDSNHFEDLCNTIEGLTFANVSSKEFKEAKRKLAIGFRG